MQPPAHPAPARRAGGHTRLPLFLVLALWFLLVLALAWSGRLTPAPGRPPLMVVTMLLLPLLITAVAWRLWPALRASLLALDQRVLIMVHGWRMLGTGFVMLFVAGAMPGLFALPAGIGDALVAVGAVWLAGTMVASGPVSPRWIMRWNLFGALDFAVAVTMGLLTRRGAPLGDLEAATSDAMASLPLVMIPAFLVPMFLITHGIIHAQLRRARNPA